MGKGGKGGMKKTNEDTRRVQDVADKNSNSNTAESGFSGKAQKRD